LILFDPFRKLVIS